ncbi:MAG: hypothetical protein ACFFDN_13915, partial [Candidatus Hodarchaeota archaeon]
MTRNKTLLLICTMSITLVLLFSAVLHTQITGNTSNGYFNGLIPYNRGSDDLNTLNFGYNVSVGLSWETELTFLNDTYLDINFTVGDRFRNIVTAINNSVVDIGGQSNEGNTVFGETWYFNSTNRIWEKDPTNPEILFSMYNNTDYLNIPNSFGNYNFFSMFTYFGTTYFYVPFYDCLPFDFTAANHTMVNYTYTVFELMGGVGNISHDVTPGGNIASNWTIWNGSSDGSDDNTYKLEYHFNEMGICNLTRVYKNGSSWELLIELKLIRMGPAYPLDFGNILGSYVYNV